jgi:hypothetical protein
MPAAASQEPAMTIGSSPAAVAISTATASSRCTARQADAVSANGARRAQVATCDAAPSEQLTTAAVDNSPAPLARVVAVIAHRERHVD